MAERTGGEALIAALKTNDVDTVFCVPGESYLAALDALYDARNQIRTITCRQEGGAAYMAEAYAKATGRPGILFVTRGPGACHATSGVHTAYQDSTPMVVLIGQVARDQEYREAFQELDYRQFYGPLCKWVAQIESADRVPELVNQAFQRAMSGRPGPVALALPEDMLRDLTASPDAAPAIPVRPEIGEANIAALREHLAHAERPMMIVGGGAWTDEACNDIVAFAEANDLPTSASFRCQDRFDNSHKNYAGDTGLGGNPKLVERMKAADLVIVVGARLGEITTGGYTLFDLPTPSQTLIHVHPDPDELGRVFQPSLPICAAPGPFASAAKRMDAPKSDRGVWSQSARQEYLANLEPTPGLPNRLDMAEVMSVIRDVLPPDAILTTDAGNFSGWMHRYYVYHRFPSQLGATNGSMGYGVPAAIAARLAYPDRPAVAFVGDGGSLMSGQEIATAVHHGIDPVILIINNGMYGTIRMHQERDFPTRTVGTSLTNPDFAAWAKSFGAFGETVQHTEEFQPAFERALSAGKAAVLDLQIEPELINTRTTLSAIRDKT
ncbi:MAG: thiamine pyrophosphate-binding protein [Pseudomonadota bacterium]